jgi:hypothetical protein
MLFCNEDMYQHSFLSRGRERIYICACMGGGRLFFGKVLLELMEEVQNYVWFLHDGASGHFCFMFHLMYIKSFVESGEVRVDPLHRSQSDDLGGGGGQCLVYATSVCNVAELRQPVENNLY